MMLMAEQPPTSLVTNEYAYLIKIIEGEVVIPLIAGKENPLGRAIENQPIKPDIDLTPYNAYEDGVSRFHASITIYNNIPVIIDLGSSNGTKVNAKLILPYEP